MKKIHLLPEDVAQKIAAGEVVERPVSVVKELVENSLDAGASEIRVDLVDGGKALIKVRDDGAGMDREDAALCFRRHSTSKIAREEDLEHIATLGFRGEALASIAAVSRLTLRTSDGSADRGTMIEREGERLVSVTDIAFPRGTSVEVRDLFFNLPARRKFLRSGQSELGPVTKYVTQAALASPGVRFTLVHGTREIVACPPVATLRERVFQLFGRKMVDGLMDVAAADGEARLEGLASLPLAGRPDKTVQYFFVNGRPVKDRILMAALSQAYTGILEKGRSPEAFLFLTLPFSEVDVNVHPAKSEVRFRDTQIVFRLVLRAVGEGAARGHTIKEVVPVDGRRIPSLGIAEGRGEYPAPGLGFEPVRGGAPSGPGRSGTAPGSSGCPRRAAPGVRVPGLDGCGRRIERSGRPRAIREHVHHRGRGGRAARRRPAQRPRAGPLRQVPGDRPDEGLAAENAPHPAPARAAAVGGGRPGGQRGPVRGFRLPGRGHGRPVLRSQGIPRPLQDGGGRRHLPGPARGGGRDRGRGPARDGCWRPWPASRPSRPGSP